MDTIVLSQEERAAYEAWGAVGGGKPIEQTGLSLDYINAFMGLACAKECLKDAETAEIFHESVFSGNIARYEEYLEDKNPHWRCVIYYSRAEQVALINLLVDTINNDYERMKDQSDYQSAYEYFSVADRLLRSTECDQHVFNRVLQKMADYHLSTCCAS